MGVLIPRQTTIHSDIKFWLEGGGSSGSSVAITFDVPEGLTSAELKIARFEEKEQLDVQVLTMELARGTIDNGRYEHLKRRVKAYYDSLLKRTKDD